MAQVLNITLSMVGVSLLLFLLAFVAGFAYDIEKANATAVATTTRTVTPL